MRLPLITTDIIKEIISINCDIRDLEKRWIFKRPNKIKALRNRLTELEQMRDLLTKLNDALEDSELVMKTDDVSNPDEPILREIGFYLIKRDMDANKKWVHVYRYGK